jgi:hypothetical protein
MVATERRSPRVVIAGGTGAIGSNLTTALLAQGFEVVILSRNPSARSDRAEEVSWDARSANGWARNLEGAVAVVNFVGKSLDCRHTPANKQAILDSRLDSVNALRQAINSVARGPDAWIQVSGVGYYGDAGDALCTEDAPKGEGFVADVVDTCENAFYESVRPETRAVALRLGIVLGGGAAGLEKLASLARWGLGGTVGSGRQYMSWVHMDDVVRAFIWSIQNDAIRGTYNVCTPNPETNADFMRALRAAVKAPWSPPVPAPLVRLGAAVIGTQPDLALDGQRAASDRIRDTGFTFRYPDLPTALENALRSDSK